MGKILRKPIASRPAQRPKPRRGAAKALASPYPKPPRELAGKWVAWAGCRIVASGDTLAAVVDAVERAGVAGASYERLPSLIRAQTH